ncbi:hypothetical protein LINPERHAP2_LOCUS42266 [Linum perenne]
MECGYDDTEIQIHPIHGGRSHSFDVCGLKRVEEEMMRLEKEMWDTFDEIGFWRSPSQREPVTSDDREATSAKEL